MKKILLLCDGVLDTLQFKIREVLNHFIVRRESEILSSGVTVIGNDEAA